MTSHEDIKTVVDASLHAQMADMTEVLLRQQDEMERLRLRVAELSTEAVATSAPDHTESEQPGQLEQMSSRRRLLRTGAAAVGAGVVAVGLGSKPAAAADGDDLILGQGNSASSPTNLAALITAGSALRVDAGGPAANTVSAVVGSSSGPFARGVSGISDHASGNGLYGQNTASTGNAIGVRGNSPVSADAIGVQGEVTAPGGRGVSGVNSAATGEARGVYGESSSTTGLGVFGHSIASSGPTVGIYGAIDSPMGTAVQGQTNTTSGSPTGVLGFTEAPEGFGVVGRNASTNGAASGAAVVGEHLATSGQADGVRGISNSPDGRAVCAESKADGGVAVWAEATGSTGVAGLFTSPGIAIAAAGRVAVSPHNSGHLPVAPIHVLQSGSPDAVELLFQLESDVPPQQTFVNNSTATKWFFAMTSDDQFKISRDGTGKVEAKFFDNGNLQIGGTLIQASDVAIKHDVEEVDAHEILDKLAAMPVSTWKYDADPGTTHLGPTAQDFASAFGLGNTDTGIATVDADGVALAAIKALHQQNTEMRAELQAQQRQIEELRDRR